MDLRGVSMMTIMSDRNLLYVLCALVLAVLVTTSINAPHVLLGNKFLVGFINHEIVNVLAVTTSVSMAWAAHLATALSSLEDSIRGVEFPRLKGTLKFNIISLGIYFVLTVVLLVIESGVDCGDTWRASIYSILLTVLLLNIILIVQNHLISFQIPTRSEIEAMIDNNVDE